MASPESTLKRRFEEDDLADNAASDSEESDIEFILMPGSGPTSAASAQPSLTNATTQDPQTQNSQANALDQPPQQVFVDINSIPRGSLDVDAIGTLDEKPITQHIPLLQEEKPWRMPTADLSDYFNYGFDEWSWMAYCNRQDKLRATMPPQMPGMMPMMPPQMMFPMFQMGNN